MARVFWIRLLFVAPFLNFSTQKKDGNREKKEVKNDNETI